MHATKETAVLAYVAMTGALFFLLLSEHGPRGSLRYLRERSNTKHAIAAAALRVTLSVVLYTAFSRISGVLCTVYIEKGAWEAFLEMRK